MIDQEDFEIAMLWIMFMRLSLKISFLEEETKTINFSVPFLSDYNINSDGIPPIFQEAPKDQVLAGEYLLSLANAFFDGNGFIPNGYVRSEYWTKAMGEVAATQAQHEMN